MRDLSESLVIQQNLHSAKSVSSLTRSGTTATVTMGAAHGWTDGDYVTIAGSDQSGNRDRRFSPVVSATFTTASGLVSFVPVLDLMGRVVGIELQCARAVKGTFTVSTKVLGVAAEKSRIDNPERNRLMSIAAVDVDSLEIFCSCHGIR